MNEYVYSFNSEGKFGTLITELIIFIGQCDYDRSDLYQGLEGLYTMVSLYLIF